MSTIDQAFVKAFARRSRPAKPASTSQDSEQPVDPPVAESQLLAGANGEDRVVRADAGSPAIPQPLATTRHSDASPAPNPFDTSYGFANTSGEQAASTQSIQDVVPTPAVEAPSPAAETPTPAVETAAPAVVSDTSAESVRPIWEVDAFDVPHSVDQLFFEEKLFQLVAKRIQDAVNNGLRSMVVTSSKAGEGRSTIAIGMAMAAATSGLRVALIDGDTQQPTLADDLRLDIDFGWLDTLRGGLPVSQIAVFSVEDGLTLIPLMPPPGQQMEASPAEVQRLITSLDDQFDLIVIDGPAGDTAIIEQYASLVDSAVIARDASRTDISTINELSYRMHAAGIQGIGIVENFA